MLLCRCRSSTAPHFISSFLLLGFLLSRLLSFRDTRRKCQSHGGKLILVPSLNVVAYLATSSTLNQTKQASLNVACRCRMWTCSYDQRCCGSRVCLWEQPICIRSQTRTQKCFFLFWIGRIFTGQRYENKSVNKQKSCHLTRAVSQMAAQNDSWCRVQWSHAPFRNVIRGLGVAASGCTGKNQWLRRFLLLPE